jgi:hypothetical protein
MALFLTQGLSESTSQKHLSPEDAIVALLEMYGDMDKLQIPLHENLGDALIKTIKAVWNMIIRICEALLNIIKRAIFAVADMAKGNQRVKVSKAETDRWNAVLAACKKHYADVKNTGHKKMEDWNPIAKRIKDDVTSANKLSSRGDTDEVPAQMLKGFLENVQTNLTTLEGIAKSFDSSVEKMGMRLATVEGREQAKVWESQGRTAHEMAVVVTSVAKSVMSHIPRGTK